MSEIDEGLDEIIRANIFDWQAMKQAILDLICKHRGCEPEPPESPWPRYSYDEAPWEKEGPCKWCGAVQRGEG